MIAQRLSLLVMALLPLLASAGLVNVESARAIAKAHVAQSASTGLTTKSAQVELAYVAPDQAYYAFNAADGGYVVVAGDDRLPEVLGFSDEGAFVQEEMPENMREWLEGYALQARALQRDSRATVASSLARGTRNVYPLLGAIVWNQSAPFNGNCPTYTASDGTVKQCATGCVATAIAQVMRYHKWPERGTGSHSYDTKINGNESDVRTISADFSQSQYDWSNMLPDYRSGSTTEQDNAVALLMSDVGVSVNMGYGASSGAVTRRAVNALGAYFGYDKGVHVAARSDYSLSEWLSVIDGELAAARPIVHTGSSLKGGHAFVLDGSNAEGYYHINWGWAGSSNGYFVLTELSPTVQGIGSSEGGYNNSQAIVVGIQPDKGGEVAYSTHIGTFECATSAAALGSKATFTWGSYYVMLPQADDVKVTLAQGVYDTLGNLVCVGAVTDATGIKAGYNYKGTRYMTIPSTLADGTYKIRPLYAPYGTTDWRLAHVSLSSNPFVEMTVSDGKAVFVNGHTASGLEVDTIKVANEVIYNDQQVLVTATLKNGGGEYFNDVYVAFMNEDGTAASVSGAKKIDVEAGAQREFQIILDAPSAGAYTLVALDADSNQIAGFELPVTVAQGPGVDYYLTCGSGLVLAADKMPQTHIEAKATVTNSGGPYAGQIEAYVTEVGSSTIKKRIYSNFITLGNKETAEVRFSTSFTGGQIGATYRLSLRNPNPKFSSSTTRWGSYKEFTVAAPCSGDVNCDSALNASDVGTVVNYVMGETSFPFDQNEADANCDGMINSGDVATLINALLAQ